MNMKRYKVNSQVTALICILEMVGAITFSIHRSFTGPTMDTLLHGQFTYFILMPYAFLMNTSHNKNRIVEHGWKNVLRNMIGIKTRPSSCNRAFPWCDDENVPECDEDNAPNIVDNQLDASAEDSTDNNDLIVSRIFRFIVRSLITPNCTIYVMQKTFVIMCLGLLIQIRTEKSTLLSFYWPLM